MLNLVLNILNLNMRMIVRTKNGIPQDVSKSGASRNKLELRYDLIEMGFLKEMAMAMYEGTVSHPNVVPGIPNYKSGFDEPGRDIDNHIWNHIALWKDGDRSEPHLGKAAVGLMFLWYFEKEKQNDKRGNGIASGHKHKAKDDGRWDGSDIGENQRPSGDRKDTEKKSVKKILGGSA
jgi:hypothetical protein